MEAAGPISCASSGETPEGVRDAGLDSTSSWPNASKEAP